MIKKSLLLITGLYMALLIFCANADAYETSRATLVIKNNTGATITVKPYCTNPSWSGSTFVVKPNQSRSCFNAITKGKIRFMIQAPNARPIARASKILQVQSSRAHDLVISPGDFRRSELKDYVSGPSSTLVISNNTGATITVTPSRRTPTPWRGAPLTIQPNEKRTFTNAIAEGFVNLRIQAKLVKPYPKTITRNIKVQSSKTYEVELFPRDFGVTAMFDGPSKNKVVPVADISGTWGSNWGPVTLIVNGNSVTGYWQQGKDKRGQFKSGTYDPASGKLTLNYFQDWNGANGVAELSRTSPGEFSGTWKQTERTGKKANGSWRITR